VVDSTADLAVHLAEDPNLTLVSATACFGEEQYLDWVELNAEFSGTCECVLATAARIDGVEVGDSPLARGDVALSVDRVMDRAHRGIPEGGLDACLQ